jgi:hypothetical protein
VVFFAPSIHHTIRELIIDTAKTKKSLIREQQQAELQEQTLMLLPIQMAVYQVL